jgi:hypothetical protein
LQAAARRIAERFASHDSAATFRDLMTEVLGAGGRPAARAGHADVRARSNEF